MSDLAIPADHNALSELLNDPIMVRVVTVVNLASLSILELLEYGFTRKDVNRAMAKGIIAFDKPTVRLETMDKRDVVQRVLETGDCYFGLLSSKVRLTKLGLYILEIVVEDEMRAMSMTGDLPESTEEAGSHFSMPPKLTGYTSAD